MSSRERAGAAGPAAGSLDRDPTTVFDPAVIDAIAVGVAGLLTDRAPAPRLLDADGAAGLLNVPRSWVLAEARANRIPHVRLGRYVRFDAGELTAWWQGRRHGPWRSRGRAAAAAHTGSDPVPHGTGSPR